MLMLGKIRSWCSVCKRLDLESLGEEEGLPSEGVNHRSVLGRRASSGWMGGEVGDRGVCERVKQQVVVHMNSSSTGL